MEILKNKKWTVLPFYFVYIFGLLFMLSGVARLTAVMSNSFDKQQLINFANLLFIVGSIIWFFTKKMQEDEDKILLGGLPLFSSKFKWAGIVLIIVGIAVFLYLKFYKSTVLNELQLSTIFAFLNLGLFIFATVKEKMEDERLMSLRFKLLFYSLICGVMVSLVTPMFFTFASNVQAYILNQQVFFILMFYNFSFHYYKRIL